MILVVLAGKLKTFVCNWSWTILYIMCKRGKQVVICLPLLHVISRCSHLKWFVHLLNVSILNAKLKA